MNTLGITHDPSFKQHQPELERVCGKGEFGQLLRDANRDRQHTIRKLIGKLRRKA